MNINTSVLIRSPMLHAALLILLAFSLYSNILNAPFTFDDDFYIVQNPMIKDTDLLIRSYMEAPRDLFGLYHIMKTRIIGYLSFALNYSYGGFTTKGYHLVNIAIHAVNGLLLYALVMITFQTPLLKPRYTYNTALLTAASASILFVLHPLQTQAVTYITQRFASLASMFYLGSIVCYAGSRLSTKKPGPLLLYACSLLLAILGMKTKETVFTLPLVIIMYELSFLGKSEDSNENSHKRFLNVLPFILLLPVIPLSVMRMEGSLGEAISRATNTQVVLSRQEYLLTQIPVLATYLRLIILPTNQNIDYDYPVYHSLLNSRVIVSLMVLISVLAIAALGYRFSRTKNTLFRMAGFGVLWFFVTISVESSVITLADVMFEHRAYLPSAGLFMAVSATIALMTNKRPNIFPHTVIAVLSVATVFSVETYSRNSTWQSETSLWEDAVKKSPLKARPWNNLGHAFQSRGENKRAIGLYEKSIQMNPSYVTAIINLGSVYEATNDYGMARQQYRKALQVNPSSAEAYYNLGITYEKEGSYENAISEYLASLKLKPDYYDALNNLGIVYLKLSRYSDAILELEKAISVDPSKAEAYFNLALIYENDGDTARAAELYNTALGLDDGLYKAHNRLGVILNNAGRADEAIEHFVSAIRIRPDFSEARNNLGIVYIEREMIIDAKLQFSKAIESDPRNYKAMSNLGGVLFMEGLFEEAENKYRQSIQIEHGYADTHANLGVLYAKQGRYGEALDELRIAKDLDPGNEKLDRYISALLSNKVPR